MKQYFQKCPVCDGQGLVSKPPYVAGDQQSWSSSQANFTCQTCKGLRIIAIPEKRGFSNYSLNAIFTIAAPLAVMFLIGFTFLVFRSLGKL